MDKPYTILFNKNGKASVVIDNRVATETDEMIERFINSGFTRKEVTENEYKEITEQGNFVQF